jgi:hypothetical protein
MPDIVRNNDASRVGAVEVLGSSRAGTEVSSLALYAAGLGIGHGACDNVPGDTDVSSVSWPGQESASP